MSDKTSIEWTSATWNPVRGCSRVSPGCGGANHMGGCYAEKIAARFSGPGQPFEGFAVRTKHGGSWTGKMALVDDMLTVPLRWRKPRRVFVNSMSDLFHENLPDEAIDKVFAVMALAPQHTYQILTKRADRMRRYMTHWPDGAGRFHHVAYQAHKIRPGMKHGMPDGFVWELQKRWPLPNVWLGVSIEDQPRADERIPDLLATPAAIRFLSCEPLLGPVDLCNLTEGAESLNALTGLRDNAHGKRFNDTRISWVITGGESGPNSRPAHPDWFRSIRDQCKAASVPFFFKQWGEHEADEIGPEDARSINHAPGHVIYRKVGKKAAGAKLDGVLHREFPR